MGALHSGGWEMMLRERFRGEHHRHGNWRIIIVLIMSILVSGEVSGHVSVFGVRAGVGVAHHDIHSHSRKLFTIV